MLVALRNVAGGLRLVVRDDGCGLLPHRGDGAGMRERALHVGGRMTVTAVPAGGTEVRLDVPLPEGPE